MIRNWLAPTHLDDVLDMCRNCTRPPYKETRYCLPCWEDMEGDELRADAEHKETMAMDAISDEERRSRD